MEHLSLVPYDGGCGGGDKYKECMRNHAAAMGGQAFDGCGEFMPDSPTDSLRCAACGCHRSFHRRAAASPPIFFRPPPPPLTTPSTQPPHHHVAALQAFLPSVPAPPHLALPYHAVPAGAAPWNVMRAGSETPPRPEDFGIVGLGRVGSAGSGGSGGEGVMGRKRFRTKFTPEQKERMREFAEQQGWRINRDDGGAMERFCHEIGVRRQVLKVWMHNHKNHGHKGQTQQHPAATTPSPSLAHTATGGADATAGVGGMVNPGIGATTTAGPNIPGLGMGVGDDDDDDDDSDDSPPRAAVSSPSPSPISV